MSTTSAAASIQHFPAELLDGFLESLRRDAFVMEAYNYKSPAIADTEDFQVAFQPLCEQVRSLFGDQATVLAAVDADGCWERDSDSLTRQVLVGLVHPGVGVRVWPKRSVRKSKLSRLADCIKDGSILGNFWSNVNPDARKFFKDSVKLGENDQVIVAPYLVRPSDDDALSAPQKKYRQVVGLWQRHRGAPEFVYTRTFCGASDILPVFRDAYYAAALVVYVPHGIHLTQSHMNWLEVFHISFQTAWGFPTLEEHKGELEAQRRRAEEHEGKLEAERQKTEDMRKQVRSFQKLQTMAYDVSATIHESLNLMRRKLDPGVGLRSGELGRLFDPDSSEIWTGTNLTIFSHHDWLETQSHSETLNCEAIKYYAVHTILKEPVSAGLGFDELRLSATKLITEADPSASPVLLLLTEVVKDGKDGFDLLKEVCRMHLSCDMLSFYALAAWFFLGQLGEDFKVHIKQNGSGDDKIILSASNFLDLDVRKSWLIEPYFPEEPGTKHKEWALVLVDLVTRALQSHDEAKVSSVTMIGATNATPCKILCHLDGPENHIDEVLGLLNPEAIQDGSGHGLRTTIRRLHEARAALSPLYFNWVTEAKNKQVQFMIGSL